MKNKKGLVWSWEGRVWVFSLFCFDFLLSILSCHDLSVTCNISAICFVEFYVCNLSLFFFGTEPSGKVAG